MHFGWHPHHETTVDLGEEPPLLVGDDKNLPPNHRRVSFRWLAGTVLTGMTSVFLMGGALFVALDGRHTFAAPPKAYAARDPLQASLTPASGPIQKGDRMKPVVPEISNKQIMTVSTVTRVGDRDFIKDRPFVHVTASLALRKTETTMEIPPFNPLRIFADTELFPERTSSDSIYGAEVDGEVSITVRDFPVDNPLLTENGPSEREIEARVLSAASFLTDDGATAFTAQPFVHPERFDFELASQRALSRLAVRIVPENVSFVPKSEEQEGATAAGLEERIVVAEKGQTFASLLEAFGANDEEVAEIGAVFNKAFSTPELPEGAKVRFGIDAAENAEDRSIPARISLYKDGSHIGTIARSDDGFYVPAEEPPTIVADVATDQPAPTPHSGPTLSLYESLYQTASEQEIPEHLIKELVRIYSFDVDFNARVKPGDSIEVLYAMEDENDPTSATEIIYTAINLKGNERHYYRFRTDDDKVVDYYDENGKSAKKFLMRKPMSRGRFRSAFGYRRHPILGYTRLHKGVDWSAPRGTPIMASGNGTVVEAKWKSGYGRWIKVRHANGYETGYAHQSGFAKGIAVGQQVRQGQIIGYVGSTGLSTGPHLHYEVMVNGRHVDPLRIRLPRGRVLTAEYLTEFKREQRHIDTLVNKGATSTRVATSQ
ncbi:MAG: M23 family peptidase [Hyphomicrobiales bacterium]|nr:MAG: M23 family peptidase [Hyphomicrobiales bacterium]